MRNRSYGKAVASIVLAACVLVSGCTANPQDTGGDPISSTGFMLDTVITITLYDGLSQDNLNGALEVCAKYEQLLSKTIEGSDVWRINHAQGAPTEVHDDTIEVIRTALKYSELSDGAFDITIGPASNLWDFKNNDPKVPDADLLAAAVSLVDYRNVKVEGNTVTLLDADAQIDLGAIAKGYIADKVVEYLASRGVTSAIVNLGGNVYAMGNKGGNDWTIGLQDPFKRRNTPISAVKLQNKSIVTSGIYERYFKTEDGTFYHHILDPKTGYSVNNGLASVTIISDKSIDGDALTTCCFVLGLEKGMQLVKSIEGVEAIFIDENEQAYMTEGIGGENGIPYLTTEDLG
ncbi:MAG: FAD:protein FMN transferase [Christensenellales bacterium]|jgi:thiamine biosynthesis lipoprotein